MVAPIVIAILLLLAPPVTDSMFGDQIYPGTIVYPIKTIGQDMKHTIGLLSDDVLADKQVTDVEWMVKNNKTTGLANAVARMEATQDRLRLLVEADGNSSECSKAVAVLERNQLRLNGIMNGTMPGDVKSTLQGGVLKSKSSIEKGGKK